MPDRGGGRLCTTVTADIGARIVAGEFAPGAALPTEAELTKKFRVSRTTVREAVKRLHGKGLVASKPRNGTVVQPTGQWNQFDAELLAWRVRSGVAAEILGQLYDIRDCFEPYACHLAAVKGSAADKDAIGRQYAAMADAKLSNRRRVAADLAFHLAIFAASRNVFMVSLGAAIRTALHLSFSLSQRESMPPREQVLHGNVCAAIQRGDGRAAEESMRRLLAASRRTLRRAIAGSKQESI